jgi:hypothetical protein
MKYFKLKYALLFSSLICNPAFSTVISGPLDYNTAGVVGTADGGTASANVATVTIYAQHILDMLHTSTDTFGSPAVYYETATTEYSGTLSGGFRCSTTVCAGGAVTAGFDYVLAKYDGQSAGYVLFSLDGLASTIPQYPHTFWTDNTTQYGLSNWTGFVSSTSIPAPNILALLGIALLGLGFARRKRSV